MKLNPFAFNGHASRARLPGMLAAGALLLLAGCSSSSTETEIEPSEADNAPTVADRSPQREAPRIELSRNVQGDLSSVNDRTTSQRRTATGVDPARAIPRLEGELREDGYGLSMYIDGSSPEAFARSLEAIAADSSPDQFQRLDSAIRFLRTYTLDARDLTSFYRSLDGLTAEEVIDRIPEREPIDILNQNQ